LSRAIQDDANRVDYQRRLPSADPGNLAPGRVVAVLTMMSLKDLLKKLFGIFVEREVSDMTARQPQLHPEADLE